MKKTSKIAALSLAAAATLASAAQSSGTLYVSCLEASESLRGSAKLVQGSCDAKRMNKFMGREVDQNGCTDSQIAVSSAEPIMSCPLPMEL